MIGEEVTIYSFRTRRSSMGGGDYLEAEIDHEGEIKTMSTGATLIMQGLTALQSHLPVRVRIGAKGRRLFLEDPGPRTPPKKDSK